MHPLIELHLYRNKISTMNLLFLIYIPISLLITSCDTPKSSKADIPLYDTKWSLKKIHTKDSVQNLQTRAFIKFNKEKASAGGNGSCNSFGSTATVNGNEVSFKNIFSTKMYCEQVQQVENQFLGSLDKINRYEIKDKTLLLYHDKELILEFTAEEEKKSIE